MHWANVKLVLAVPSMAAITAMPAVTTMTPAPSAMIAAAVPSWPESEINARHRSIDNRRGGVNDRRGLVYRWIIGRGGLIYNRSARHHRGREREAKSEADANPGLASDGSPEQNGG